MSTGIIILLFYISSDYFQRFRPALITQVDDALPDYMNLMGMIFSMCSLMLKVSSFNDVVYLSDEFFRLNGVHGLRYSLVSISDYKFDFFY